MLSVLDIFKIGIGPSSSHTVGPMRIGARFIGVAEREGVLERAARLEIHLHGSLALTGIGHGTDRASLLGVMGFAPDDFDATRAQEAMEKATAQGKLDLRADLQRPARTIDFDRRRDLHLRGEIVPVVHPNEMRLVLFDAKGQSLLERTYYSVGGGFIASERQLSQRAEDDMIALPAVGPHRSGSGRDLLDLAATNNQSIAQIILENEDARRPRAQTEAALDRIWDVMNASIDRGLNTKGILPGVLKVSRRAPGLYRKLTDNPLSNEREELFDWLNVYAMAVNEENAAGGQVVTAPTNGAAGIIPAIIRHYAYKDDKPFYPHIRTFLVTAAGIGMLYKQRASISGAEMGCQGEVGVACSMAAGGLAAIWGGTPPQVEHAAEIGMEHNLGLTCDPIAGLVQIPCIERNAIGAVKAVNAARLALHTTEPHKVSLDQVIETMRQTGLDMSRKYKETSEGGLAATVPVNVVEC